jgi:hypothetical protein
MLTNASDGKCAAVASGKRRNDGCSAMAPGDCGTTGYCDGEGRCALYAAGTACAAPTCAAGVQTSFVCDGQGACQPNPVVCDHGCNNAGQCFVSRAATACQTDEPCRLGYRCGPAGACLDRCESMSDCAEGESGVFNVCNRDHQCAPFVSTQGAGRGCVVSRHDQGAWLGAGGLLFALAWILRRIAVR